jgi:hypothetical protein
MADDPAPVERADLCEHCGQAAVPGGGESLRCVCGSMLARRVAGGIELKCRRCKRTVIVAIEPDGAEPGTAPGD